MVTSTNPRGLAGGFVDRWVNVGLAAGVFLAVVVEGLLQPSGRGRRDRGDDLERIEDFDDLRSLFDDGHWDEFGSNGWLAVVLVAALAAGCVLMRRRWPVPVVVVMGATATVATGALGVNLASSAAFALTLYSGGVERGWFAGAAAGGAATLVAVGVAAGDDSDVGVLLVAAFAVLVVVVPLLAAATTRSRRAYLAEVQARLAQARAEQSAVAAKAVADERVRLARDLHDVLAHSLTVMNLQVGVAAHMVPEHPDRARLALHEARAAGASALAELRTTLALMRGDEPENRAPVPTVTDVAALVDSIRATGLRVELHDLPTDASVNEAVGLVAFRVVQEGLTNAVRHGGVDAKVSVTLELSGGGEELRVRVADSGGSAPPAPGGGLGLLGLAERCRALGGTFDAGPQPGGGFALEATLPTQTGDS